MKKLLIPFIALMMIVALGSCSGSKEIAYFQNIDSISLAASKGLFDARIMPKDELTITVSGEDPEVVRPFNLTVQSTLNLSTASNLAGASGRLMPYLVDNNGDIRFPVIGKLHVMGLTKRECEELILEKIRPHFTEGKEPIVTVVMSSFRVTVIGEVGRANVLPVTTEKMSVIEALAACGDLSIYGKRKNILLIREDPTGQKTAHRIDLTDANIFNSPYYYVQQNDIIYVEPNTVKAKNSSIGQSTTIWFSFIGIVTSVASLLVNILRD
ncbi:MAG: polysaccharide biosynthesis/export family protein [Prevotella sp.]|nr:polysaccharide biosynthesis/export family protein [Prevotella sp.]